MKKKKYQHALPKGWTLAEVQKIADSYDRQSEDEGAAEIASAPGEAEMVMIVPTNLAPRIRKFIADNGPQKARSTKSRRVA